MYARRLAPRSHPEPFPYEIVPRSDAAAELVRQAYEMTRPAGESEK